MEQDQDDNQNINTELDLHEESRKGHLKRAISILTEESKDEDYDDKKSNEAWKHITEASKQRRIARQLSKRAAKHMKKQVNK